MVEGGGDRQGNVACAGGGIQALDRAEQIAIGADLGSDLLRLLGVVVGGDQVGFAQALDARFLQGALDLGERRREGVGLIAPDNIQAQLDGVFDRNRRANRH